MCTYLQIVCSHTVSGRTWFANFSMDLRLCVNIFPFWKHNFLLIFSCLVENITFCWYLLPVLKTSKIHMCWHLASFTTSKIHSVITPYLVEYINDPRCVTFSSCSKHIFVHNIENSLYANFFSMKTSNTHYF